MRPRFLRERWLFGALLTLWTAHVLAYVWIVPPWQHYDEPTHFEYAALIRELGRVPALDEDVPALKRAIAVSMVDSGFFERSGTALQRPNLDAPDLSLGVNERGHPPLYYIIVAIATLPFQHAPVETQLYAARLVSAMLAVLLFVAAYAALRLATGDDRQARFLALGALALQPAFADNMSSVNSDALANLVAVLLLLTGLLIVRRPNWRSLVLGVLLVALAWNVKRTLLVPSLVVPAAMLLAAPRVARRVLALAAGAGALAGLTWLLVQPWPLADWKAPSSAQTAQAPQIEPHQGQGSFLLTTVAGQPAPALSQSVYEFRQREAAGKDVTLSAWMRADRAGVQAWSPALQIDGATSISHSVTLGAEWRLVTVTATLPPASRYLTIHLPGPPTPGTLAYDSLSLVVGPAATPPDESEPDGSFEPGLLGPQAPRNMIRNAGAERRVPSIPSPLLAVSGRMLDDERLAQVLSTIFHPAWIAAVYPQQLLLLFQGAWGVFGWGQFGVNPGWFTPLALLVVGSVLGAIVYTWRARWPGRADPALARAWWLCLLAVALGWGTALLRVHNQPFPGTMFWSFGRYTFVAMVPSMLVFAVGLRALFPPALRQQGLAAVFGFLAIFALVALSIFA